MRLGRSALVVFAAAAALVPTPSAPVERYYSLGVYPPLQHYLTSLSNSAPLALLDVLLILIVGAWIALALRDLLWVDRGFLRALISVAGRTAVWGAALYVVFLAVWGLNYRRPRLIEKLSFDASAVTADAARQLALRSADQLNALHDAAHASGWASPGAIDSTLADALARADREIGGRGMVMAGRPKSTVLDWYFRRAAVAGMTDPYFLETLVSSSLLPFERPFVEAHEWSHLAGIADEGDANFLAWLSCVHGPPTSQYSGWLFLFGEVAGSLRGGPRADAIARLGPGPRADLDAIRARLERDIDRRVLEAGRRVYDRYLKANRVESGVESYGEVVQLVLGVRFDSDWVPLR